MALEIKNAKTIQENSRKMSVRHGLDSDNQFCVTSTSGKTYEVISTPAGLTCNCMWGTRGDTRPPSVVSCKHATATANFIANKVGYVVSVWAGETRIEDAARQHKAVIEIEADGVILTYSKRG